MNDVNAISDFLRNVIKEELPDELIEFELSGEKLIESSLSDDKKDKVSTRDDHYEFGVSIADALQFIGLVKGTIETLKMIFKLFKSNNSESVELELVHGHWMDTLVDAGINEGKALIIVKRFSKDLEILAKSTSN